MVDSIPFGADDIVIMGRVEQQQWSFLNVPIYWAAAGVQDDIGTIEWLERVIEQFCGIHPAFHTLVPAGAARGVFQAIRRNMRHMGIANEDGLRTWLG
eukprot:7187732-Pyramimonas_sp.AAC.1